MAGTIGSVSGLVALRQRLDLGKTDGAIVAALQQEADAIVEEARRTLEAEHHGTGALARSVSVVEGGNEDAPRFTVGTDQAVGRYLEFGTRRMPAAPWLLPALHARLPEVKASLRTVLKTMLRLGE